MDPCAQASLACLLQDLLSATGGRPFAVLQGSRLPALMLDAKWMQQQQQWWREILGHHLTPDKLAALAQLSVFPYSFSLEGAQAVAPDLGMTTQVLEDLQQLMVIRPAGVFG